ncbi:MAG: hypothetical protein ACRDDY_02700 [Clostridium sp.]|uniref:hypothetical protein n=1 Tax=Clostridium sp. TaxID=1506 RepID=UPI003EE4C80A
MKEERLNRRKQIQIIDGVEYAWCSTHRKYEPKEMFYKEKRRWNGVRSECKVASRESVKEYRRKNKAEISKREKLKNPNYLEKLKKKQEKIDRELRGE